MLEYFIRKIGVKRKRVSSLCRTCA